LTGDYTGLLDTIKNRIRTAQTRAILSANSELIRLYWEIGQMIDTRQKKEGWGAGVITRLAQDLHNELPEEKGFSRANLMYMRAFADAWSEEQIVQQPVGQLPKSDL
ncbi:MAG: DUF1016 domain-containing protein, partial [Desulfamplus sp.]|nr:DUF1016 domain-containing protein [Desulfamplus sp.]